MRSSQRAEKLEEARQPKRIRNKQTVDQVIMMMMEMEKVVEQHQAVEAWVLKMKSIIGLLRELILHCWQWEGADMKTTINCSLKLQGKSSTRSSSSSTTGVSVREPLNVRLQRLLSSDQSSAYTILDILQVIFLILSLAGSCPVSMEEVSAHLCASWGQIVMTVMAFRLFAV